MKWSIQSVLVVQMAIMLGLSVRDLWGDDRHQGSNVSISADGMKVAFQRHRNGSFDIGVLDMVSKSIKWIDEGPADAVFPAWCSDGSLVYVRYEATNTAFQAVQNGLCDGFNLFHYKNGERHRLMCGRWFDSTSTFAPDGKTLYYVSTEGEGGTKSHLWKMDVDHPEGRRRVFCVGGRDAGVASPSVSPDGKRIVWAQYDGTVDSWHINAARTDDLSSFVCISPKGSVAWSPTWHPDGRHVLFTGFLPDDNGWCVYLMDVKGGGFRKLSEGRCPCVFPDGERYVCEQGGSLRCGRLGPINLPITSCLEHELDDEKENVCLALSNLTGSVSFEVPYRVVSLTNTVFCRVVISFAEFVKMKHNLFEIEFNGNKLALQMNIDDGFVQFATRTMLNDSVAIVSGTRSCRGRCVFTGIRGSDGKLYLSTGAGGVAVRQSITGVLPLAGGGRGVVRSEAPGIKVEKFEIGVGWPRNVGAPMTRKRLFE